MSFGFEDLTPDCILEAVEESMQFELTGLTVPLPSYINRVYELQALSGERLIAKFYRPERWTHLALQDEHNFVFDCLADEVPVVAPLVQASGETLGEYDGISFALFPKRSGREMNLNSDDDWRRLGRLVGRIHLAGSRADADHRLVMHPETMTVPQVNQLLDGGFMSSHQSNRFSEISSRILDLAFQEFDGVELQRIHGDCHRANILERQGEGLMVIDFDDMVMGPPVQDLWLLLPDYVHKSRHEMNLILEGYEQFLEFDDRSLRLVEILRAMRNIYFLSWCSMQIDDFRFKSTFPNWGDELFWQREISDIERQYHTILKDERLNLGGMT